MSEPATNKSQRQAPKARSARILTVKTARHLTPNMIRVTLIGDDLAGFPEGCEGGNCKLVLPDLGETLADFTARVAAGESLVHRTYTVRHYRAAEQELDIDFVAHGDRGPASRWATHAEPGSFLGFKGPSGPKLAHFEADWYLVAADLSALPVAAASLEAMPRDARGVAVFEVTSAEDRQDIDAPEGIEVHWLVHPEPQIQSDQQEKFMRSLEWPQGRVQTCIAGESGAVKGIRQFLRDNADIERKDLYLSGYWKVGMVEDEHQVFKRSDV
ncbi:MAG: siderophore-interacting protein [Pseudomonadota bacterium]